MNRTYDYLATPLRERAIQYATDSGSRATTLRGALRHGIHSYCVRRRLAGERLEPWQWETRQRARVRYADARRALAMGGAVRRQLLRRLRAEYRAIYHADTITAANEQLAAINARRAILGLAELPMLDTRVAHYSELMRQYGPIPRKSSAGELIQVVTLGDVLDCKTDKVHGDQSSVPRSYGYRVWDHIVTWTIPRDHHLRVIYGVITVLAPGDYRRSRRTPVRCHWPERSIGYHGKWLAGWLYREYHSRDDRGLVETVTQQRARLAKDARLARAQRARRQAISDKVWVSREALRAVGACSPGIDAARPRVEELLHADGEIGAVRADWLLGTEYAPWAARVIDRALCG